ncbi:E3 ubiquitin/ISG15 ligase TRIM25-like isoform X2 [Clupea harengus]|uniref:E3 ubiquitin/ISG15 ligase TRIM25-like isoform X2 n=1 Tax=Clupea harengus TaxID=7950 RepID=A0A6P8F3M9_CLUHA|nr:E3 ubiquitin/ISG15 ligase TRIM25-like isoform X2 [Clupea harengus]
MAQANISVTESQFRCPICLDILNDPVSIPCGHTYCMLCMNSYWDQAVSGPYSCPQCRETFSPRPVLRRNTVLAEVVEKLKLTDALSSTAPELYRGVGDVPCDFCSIDGKLKAVKSCLACLASYCELHVAPHREVGTLRRHKLVAAIDNLPDRLCAQHRLGLEGGGPDTEASEWSGDCLLCESDQEELHHVDTQRARRQAQLQDSQRTVQLRIRSGERELEECQQTFESLKCSAGAVREESEVLFGELAQRMEKAGQEVRARLEARERAVLGRVEHSGEELRCELDELRRREQEMSQLLLSEDNAHFLQAAPLLCILPASGRRPRAAGVPTECFRATRRALCHLRSRMEELCGEEVDKISRAVNDSAAHPVSAESQKVSVPIAFPVSILALQPSDQRMRSTFLRYACRLTLDPDTAHPTLFLMDGPQGAHCGEEPQAYPLHPLRFDSVAQVLCKEGQFGGASYWEVEWQGGGWVDVGVTYRAVGRKGGGKPCLLGRNDNSWRLRCTHAGYAAWHDNRKITVAAEPSPRIGVFLDRHKGELSFYRLANTVELLHMFRCPFSQPLYPAFRLDLDSTLLICPLERGNGDSSTT